MELLPIVTHPKGIANIKTRCKEQRQRCKLHPPRIYFPPRGFAVLATSGQLRAVNYLINSKQEFSVHWQKPGNREITPAAVIQSEAAGVGGSKT